MSFIRDLVITADAVRRKMMSKLTLDDIQAHTLTILVEKALVGTYSETEKSVLNDIMAQLHPINDSNTDFKVNCTFTKE